VLRIKPLVFVLQCKPDDAQKLEEADGIEEIRPEIGPRIASIARG
jgi:hypothetical protein